MMDRKADAEATGFSDNRFDIITEYGSLHHVDLHLAFAEMARVLKPDGKAICQEALAHNLLIHAEATHPFWSHSEAFFLQDR
jgi:ubiquinone/menaquinone biosynthesis C-methylase UbiE